MKRDITLIALAALALGACDRPAPRGGGGGASGNGGAKTPAAANAAELYRGAFARMGKEQALLIGSVTFTERGADFDSTAPGNLQQAFAALKGQQAVVADLIKAGEMEACDFGLPHPKGDGQEMQQVLDLAGKLRAASRLLNADAARAWSEGDTDGAVNRIVALYGLSAHVAEEPIVLTGLTNVALEMLANQTTKIMAAGAGGKTLSAAQREMLVRAIDRLNSGDPSGLTRAREAEGVTDAGTLGNLKAAEAKIRGEVGETRGVVEKR